ncbi:MAG: DUF559 domain-containing protein [Nanoarchaeota archaeon]
MYYEKSKLVRSKLEDRFLQDCITVGLIVNPDYKIGPIHADFAIPDRKIAIEVDSKQYHSSDSTRKEDEKRNKIYRGYGWKIIRISGNVVMRKGEDIAWEIKRGNYDDYPETILV